MSILLKLGYVFVLFSVLSGGMACGHQTNITSSWKSDSGKYSNPFTRVMIVAIVPPSNSDMQQHLEQALSMVLSRQGITTTSAFAQYGPKAFENKTEEEVLRSVSDAGIQGVITISLLNKEKERNYRPGRVEYYQGPVRYNRFYGYYRRSSRRVVSPGYFTTTTKFFVETNLYDVSSNTLLYSAQSKTIDPSSIEKFAADYAEVIVRDMKAKNMVGAR